MRKSVIILLVCAAAAVVGLFLFSRKKASASGSVGQGLSAVPSSQAAVHVDNSKISEGARDTLLAVRAADEAAFYKDAFSSIYSSGITGVYNVIKRAFTSSKREGDAERAYYESIKPQLIEAAVAGDAVAGAYVTKYWPDEARALGIYQAYASSKPQSDSGVGGSIGVGGVQSSSGNHVVSPKGLI